MARLSLNMAVAGGLALCSAAGLAGDRAIPPEIPDPESAEAFEAFWKAFEEYETRISKEGRQEFRRRWADVAKEHRRRENESSRAIIKRLENAVSRYRDHLREHPEAENRPYVLLNMARALDMLASEREIAGRTTGSSARSEAVSLLSEIRDKYPTFPLRERAFYLKGLVLESMDRDQDALAAWKELSSSDKNTLYGVHAKLVLGDRHFDDERPAKALTFFKAAADELEKAPREDRRAFEKLRIDYRMAWSAYRAAELETAIRSCRNVLTASPLSFPEEKLSRIRTDAAEIMGDALYEKNSFSRIKRELTRSSIEAHAPRVGLRILQRYGSTNAATEAARIGRFLVERFSMSKQYPKLLRFTATAEKDAGHQNRRIRHLEKLAMLLPDDSLWRSRHDADPQTIRAMEEKAAEAARHVAAWHYQRGLSANRTEAYNTAASYYRILLEHEPHGPRSISWRIRRADCHFFAGRLEKAATFYQELKQDYDLGDEDLQHASYQLVLTREKLWRQSYREALESGKDPAEDEQVSATLADLERGINGFAARFSDASRATDLLLVGASANRDLGRYDEAAGYWKRALVTDPAASQRAVAIRGLVFAAMKTGNSADVVTITRRFLQLENWEELGLNLGHELRGVLSRAVQDEAERLQENGRVEKAGELLLEVADETPKLPQRQKLMRDGGYLLAIGGAWAAAEKASKAYLTNGLGEFRGDMLYLLCRSHEYQLRLHEAARSYFRLGQNHPRHSHSKKALRRAEKLAKAEGDYDLAARAARLRAQRAQKRSVAQNGFERAGRYFEKTGNLDAALETARAQREAVQTRAARLSARLTLARLRYHKGFEREAIDDYQVLAKRIDNARGSINDSAYAQLAGEVHYRLGEEARRRFEDFGILERGGSISSNVSRKTRYFEELVSSYDKTAKEGAPRWAAEARYRIARAASALAGEIASIPSKTDKNLSFKARNRYNETVKRLRRLARRYDSTNVLQARKDPSRYRDVKWVRLSKARLAGQDGESTVRTSVDLTPQATDPGIPMTWSL